MTNREFVEDVLDALRNMDDAIDVICNLDVDAVMDAMGVNVDEDSN